MKHRKTRTRRLAIDIPDGVDIIDQEPRVPRTNLLGYALRPVAVLFPMTVKKTATIFYN